MRAPLVRRGSPADHALSLANRSHAIRRSYNAMRRRVLAVYGYGADPSLVLLLDRYEERLDALTVTADALRDHLLRHAPAPRDDMDGMRLCLNPACRQPLHDRKSTAECCGGPCRAAVSRLRAAGLLPLKPAARKGPVLSRP